MMAQNGEKDWFADGDALSAAISHDGQYVVFSSWATNLASNGTVLEVLASNKGSWTIILTKPDGMSCVVASGEAWEQVEQHLALGPQT